MLYLCVAYAGHTNMHYGVAYVSHYAIMSLYISSVNNNRILSPTARLHEAGPNKRLLLRLQRKIRGEASLCSFINIFSWRTRVYHNIPGA